MEEHGLDALVVSGAMHGNSAMYYMVNGAGISFGEEVTFNTAGCQGIKPTVTTSAVDSITGTTAKGGGQVTDGGSAPVTARGTCWGTSPDPDTTGAHTTDGAGTREGGY